MTLCTGCEKNEAERYHKLRLCKECCILIPFLCETSEHFPEKLALSSTPVIEKVNQCLASKNNRILIFNYIGGSHNRFFVRKCTPTTWKIEGRQFYAIDMSDPKSLVEKLWDVRKIIPSSCHFENPIHIYKKRLQKVWRPLWKAKRKENIMVKQRLLIQLLLHHTLNLTTTRE